MKDPRTLDRRQFTVAAALAALSGVTITITACGGGGGSPSAPSTPPPTPGPGDRSGVIGTNHGHSGAVISAAELASPRAITLDIRGSADHPHTLTLSQADVTAIAAGTRVARSSSSDDGHNHTVTFN